jgi:nucleotide-binding universal stress UspA family protein
MKQILLPTDFSENSKHAIKYAVNLFKNEDCHFTLLNTYQVPQTGAGRLVSIIDLLKEESEKDLQEFYELIKKEGLTEGFDYTLMNEHGDLLQVIKNLGKKTPYDLIVMGTKGASGIKEILIGSNTSEVIKNGIFPVLAVPEDANITIPSRIVLASDNKPINNEKSLQTLMCVVNQYNAEVLVVYVATPQAKDIVQNTNILPSEIKHSYHMIHNEDVIEGINKFIEEKDAKIITLVSRDLGFFERIFHKSITKKLAMHSQLPILALFD